MSDWLKGISEKIKELSHSIDEYKKDTVIQSLPSYTYVNRAKVLMEQEKYEEAKEILLKALELPQKDALVYKYLGGVYEKLGEHQKAVDAYQDSADINPQDKIIWQRLGFELITIGKYENAVKSFENADRVQALNSDTFTGWGMAYMKLNNYKEAMEKFNVATQYNKYNFSAMFLSAVMEMKLEMYDKAEAKLTFLANVSPNSNSNFELARLKAIKDDIESAIHYAVKSIDLNNKMLPAYILLGQLYTQKHDYENMTKYFQMAEDLGLENPSLYLEWGKALEKFEKLDDAKIKLLKAYEMDNEALEIKANLGLCYVNKKEFENGKPLLEEVISKSPDNKVVKQGLAIINYENGEIDKAMEVFRLDDEDFVNAYYLAKCYEKLENDEKVRDYFEAAININPSYVGAYLDYAKYLLDKNEYKEAQRKLRKGLKYNSDNLLLLNLMFYVSYILVKENVCEYNVKETIAIAQKIESINSELFEYPLQKQELAEMLANL